MVDAVIFLSYDQCRRGQSKLEQPKSNSRQKYILKRVKNPNDLCMILKQIIVTVIVI